MILEINNLSASVEGKEILKNVNLTVKGGEIHALMGPNGAGKSTLGNVLIGHPDYKVTGGNVLLDGKDITFATPEERARAGLFLAFQSPVAVEGVRISTFLRIAYSNLHPGEKIVISEFNKKVKSLMKTVGLDESFISRSVNDGFSGGERKRFEILQMMILKPKIIILDEIDSGLDVDALRMVAEQIRSYLNNDVGFLIITHYQRILKDIPPQFVHVLVNGTIVMNGDKSLSDKIEEEGYDWLKEVA
ncbi:ABC transport system ATP-binding protein [Thermoplasma volcanium GSS1]|uniref:ABC transport system ATP-binding protein n=1 Tax=Thermoplasma volcanium (strain ATCC 51530 / DSM 4299 / JCM 9571 / NBRC 15438 / GSS1) TaxID=273116 RepID=Q978J8_THEVO|nr:Fe-S cluster assembly ATPase SufC [Thermoplasma volcanium]BAB60559.1 ABC transport system ATP-binding protein [Thermoplasma volcanium GSS1]